MAVRPIVRFPDSRLRQTSAPVKAVDDDVRRVVADMNDSNVEFPARPYAAKSRACFTAVW